MSFFFVASKILYFLTTPVVWIFGFGLFALLAKNQVKRKRRLLWSVLLLFFFTNEFIFDEFSRPWEVEQKKLADIRSYKVGVVLGGYAFYNPKKEQVNMYESADRLTEAIRLYKLGKIEKIALIGGTGSLIYRDLLESEYAKSYLIDIGIPDEDILIDAESNNTRENAINAKKLIEGNNFSGSVLLITSTTHMRRSKSCFSELGVVTTSYAVDPVAGPRRFHFDHLFIPNGQVLKKWNGLIHEWVGYGVYFVLGYV